MNIDRLIDRIEKALREEGTTDPVYHALAKEYAKYRTQIDERLEHCVTLIRSGKDFAARELAEQPPDVLTLMEKLSFSNDGKWRALCDEKGLYVGPNWAEEHVDLLNGLYDKEITEDSPLFREYRTAARSRDEDKTFKILKMILKANPDHASARRHFGQLSVKIQENKIKELDELIQSGREAEFLDLMLDIEETDWVVPPKGDQWENALAVRIGVERRNAKLRLEEILLELASFRSADDWKGSLALIGEFFNLAQEHSLEGELDADDINVYNEYKEWAEELAEEAKAERELEGMVSSFKNRLAEMQQLEVAGGKSLETYLAEQNELRKFRQDFQDIGKSLSAEIMMDLQKAENQIKNRIQRLRGRTKIFWIAAVALFLLVAASSVVALAYFSGPWGPRKEAARILEDKEYTAGQRWDQLSPFSRNYSPDWRGIDYLEDEDVRRDLGQAMTKVFEDATNNLAEEDQKKFLFKTQDKALLYLSKDDVQAKRAEIVAAMCDRILEQANQPTFEAKTAKDFLELFEEPPRIRKDENGNPLPLKNVDFHRFQENDVVLDKLQEIAGTVARMEDSNDRMKERFDSLKQKIDRFDKEVLIAWKKFRDTEVVDHGILAQEKYLDGLDTETREFSGSEAVDPNDYREVRDALRDLRKTWRSFSKEVESKSGSQIDTLLNEAEKIGNSVSRVEMAERPGKIKEMGEVLERVIKINKSATEQMRMNSTQERRLGKLLEMRNEILDKIKKAGAATAGTGLANSVDEYLFSLEEGLSADAFSGPEIKDVRTVLANRNKFSNEKGELRKKLFLKGPPDIWEKLEKGEISLMTEDSKDEYEYLKSMMERYELLNLWSYRLVECSPLKTGRSGVYTTSKTPVAPLTSYGEVQMDRMEKKFDDQGQPISNPSATVTQKGTFHWNGKREGRVFESTHFNGGAKGLMVDNGQLCPESRFLRLQIDRRMDPNTKTLVGPLMEMLEVVIADQTISPLLKAYLHMELVELMKKKPAAWGVALSGQLLQDYEALITKVKVRIRPTDWMDGQAYKELAAVLAQYYGQLGKRDYFPESRFTLDLLGQLQKIDFNYVGFVDSSGRQKFSSTAPSIYWGLEKGGGSQLVQASTRSSPNFQPHTPLIATSPTLEAVLAQSYSKAKVQSGKYGMVSDILPIDFSQD
ncbi:MAG: hypothetical protein HN531_01800 [Opitutae bacterium]|nr:hypothetical protein [Opitutae bacterium]